MLRKESEQYQEEDLLPEFMRETKFNKDLITIQLICDLISKIDQNTKSKLLDAQNKDGNTALHLAVQLCQIKNNPESIMWEAMAKILDNAGTNKNIQNKNIFAYD